MLAHKYSDCQMTVSTKSMFRLSAICNLDENARVLIGHVTSLLSACRPTPHFTPFEDAGASTPQSSLQSYFNPVSLNPTPGTFATEMRVKNVTSHRTRLEQSRQRQTL